MEPRLPSGARRALSGVFISALIVLALSAGGREALAAAAFAETGAFERQVTAPNRLGVAALPKFSFSVSLSLTTPALSAPPTLPTLRHVPSVVPALVAPAARLAKPAAMSAPDKERVTAQEVLRAGVKEISQAPEARGKGIVLDRVFDGPRQTASAAESGDGVSAAADPIAAIVKQVHEAHPETRMEAGHPVYRATYRPDYDLNSLMGYLRGERQFEMRSWDFQHRTESQLASGIPPKTAVENAEKELSANIEEELVRGDFTTWVYKQISGTVVVRRLDHKTGSAVPFALNSPAGALLYVKTQLTYFPPTPPEKRNPVILYKVQEQAPRGLSLEAMEYYILSHVPARDVSGAFVGNWEEGDTVKKWHYISVAARNQDGSARTLKVFEAELAGGDFKLGREVAVVDRSAGKLSQPAEDLPKNLADALSRF